ncbi:MAG TPA: hypothetical protein VH370_13785 [Humisphaera sp.]|jgi:hypothetical protein|nr:hypothetical protein [Humisphaera sp.]
MDRKDPPPLLSRIFRGKFKSGTPIYGPRCVCLRWRLRTSVRIDVSPIARRFAPPPPSLHSPAEPENHAIETWTTRLWLEYAIGDIAAGLFIDVFVSPQPEKVRVAYIFGAVAVGGGDLVFPAYRASYMLKGIRMASGSLLPAEETATSWGMMSMTLPVFEFAMSEMASHGPFPMAAGATVKLDENGRVRTPPG